MNALFPHLVLFALAGSSVFAARQSGPDPLGDALSRELHKVDELEPTITCTPEEETTC
ncbi:hypothetical protein [Streptosporangium vulgare]|uniref:Uncharacterized protein n=1 Tax=Streptosporangium vulgare TaxID=46190 RepID=A0ABV5TQ77_9ACTN